MALTIDIIEDDLDIARIERLALEKQGYAVSVFPDGKTFYASLQKAVPSLIVLDLMLPDIQGMEILHDLRSKEAFDDTDILIVSAKGMMTDKVEGLDLGADDYIEKPFSVLELMSRVNARFRRKKTRGKECYHFAGFFLDGARHELLSPEKSPIRLSGKEWDLLLALLKADGNAVSRDELLRAIWGDEGAYESRTVDVHVVALRRKLNDPLGKMLETVFGIGYRLNR
jgi:two-component system, OmpR family, alkaline phosphatase synthesis response regulator PhoP